jgi:hypothetical protein
MDRRGEGNLQIALSACNVRLLLFARSGWPLMSRPSLDLLKRNPRRVLAAQQLPRRIPPEDFTDRV